MGKISKKIIEFLLLGLIKSNEFIYKKEG